MFAKVLVLSHHHVVLEFMMESLYPLRPPGSMLGEIQMCILNLKSGTCLQEAYSLIANAQQITNLTFIVHILPKLF